MERRKDTANQGARLPRDYLKLVEEVFNKNFSKKLLVEKGKKEAFAAFGEVFPDELILVASLRHPDGLRMTTCYASIDYPPKKQEKEPSPESKPSSVSENVQAAVNSCVDALASFFQAFFEEGRPVDYDVEYRQGWTPLEIEKGTKVYLRINRDNLDLEAQADAILEAAAREKPATSKASSKKSKKVLH